MKRITTLLSSKYPAILWTVLIFVLCTLPSEHLPKNNDKTNHLLAFAGFTFFWLFHASRYWLILLIAVVYGIGIEFWQATLPASFHRGFEWYDALADSIGGVMGYFIYLIFRKLNLLNL